MKKLSLIYAAGMYESRGEIGGLFLGSGDSLLLGKYRGTSESQLSKMVGPPRKVRYVVPVNLWRTGFFVVMAFAGRGKLSSVTGFLSTVYVLLFPGYIVAGLLHSFFIYSPKFLTWDQKFMCQRCGATIKETSHTV